MEENITGTDIHKGESYCLQETGKTSEAAITMNELFTPEFMKLYTNYESIETLLASGGFEINSEEDYEAIPDDAIDAHVADSTDFRSWKDMLTFAIHRFSLVN